MLSSIIFINMRGDVLIYRIYKDDISRTETFNFCTRLIANKNKKETPVLYLDGTTFFYVPYKDFILVADWKIRDFVYLQKKVNNIIFIEKYVI